MPVDPARLIHRQTCLRQKLQRSALVERFQRDAAKESLPLRSDAPRRDRGLAPSEDQADVVAQLRHEDLAQPGVHQAKHLVGVQGQHHPFSQGTKTVRHRTNGDLLGLDSPRELLDEAPLGGLDEATVQGHHHRPARLRQAGETREQSGLSHSSNAVEVEDEYALILEQTEQSLELPLPAHHARRGPLSENISNTPRHLPTSSPSGRTQERDRLVQEVNGVMIPHFTVLECGEPHFRQKHLHTLHSSGSSIPRPAPPPSYVRTRRADSRPQDDLQVCASRLYGTFTILD